VPQRDIRAVDFRSNGVEKEAVMPKQKVQGEGDYQATRRYRKRTAAYLANNDVEKAARRAAPRDRKEAEAMKAAEAVGKRRARR
jgi:hypothetical protein